MAQTNPFVNSAINPLSFMAPDVALDATRLARQQALVDALKQRAMEDPQTQVVSGIAIQNGMAPLTKLASALIADRKQKTIDQQQAALAQRYADALSGQSAGAIDADTLRQAAILDSVSPGAGKALITQKLEQGKPIDAVRDAQQLFPNDPTRQQQYLNAWVAKNTNTTLTPGSVVSGMGGTTEVPMSAYQRQQLANDKERLKLQDRSTAATELNANTAARTAGANGGFAGTGMDAQAMNVYSNLSLKAQSQTLTPQEQLQLDLAIRHLTQPRIGGTAETGFYEIPAQPLPTLGAPSNVNAPAAAPPSAPVVAPPSAPAAPPPAAPAAPQTAAPQAGAMPRVLTEPNRKPTQEQLSAAKYVSRMENAETIFTEFPDGAATLQTQAMSGVPLVGDALKRASQTDSQQLYQQAQEDWVRAKLRDESGAVIGAEEMRDEIRTYFPQPGDKPEVIRQKARARAIAIEALRKEAGPAYYKSSVSGGDEPASRIKWNELPQ